MGCSSCGNGGSIAPVARRSSRRVVAAVAIGDCQFTNEILSVWYEKLKTLKSKGTYKKYGIKASRLNRYLGITLTALNVSNKCFDVEMLNQISEFVTYIIGLENE